MSRLLLPCVLCALMSCVSAAAGEAANTLAGKVLRVGIGNADLTDPGRWRELRKLMDEATEAGVAAFVLDLNITAAPALTALPLAEEIAHLKVRTLAYVNPSAVAGGALLALGCDEIWMAPGSRIGAAPPPIVTEKDMSASGQETQFAESLALLKAGARGLCKLKGHRPDLAVAFVDRTLGFEAGGHVYAAKGELTLLDGDDAAAKVDGKPLLAKAVVPRVEDVLKGAGLSGELATLSATLLQKSKVAEPKKVNAPKTQINATAQLGHHKYAGKVVVIPVGEEDLMARARFEFMSRTLARCTAEGAEAVIFDLDTPGGALWDTTNLMMKDLQKLKPRSIAFVNPRAMSAGAMIAVATDAIYMAPASSAGAATPIFGNGMEMDAATRAKMNSATMSMARTVAKEKGHNPRVIEAMIDKELGLTINGEILAPKGQLLTLDARQAVMEVDGKPLFAKAIVKSLDEIKAAEGLKGETIVAEPTGFEQIAIWVTRFAALLIMIGVAAGYVEMHTPGFGLPGFISITAFAIFFFGHYVAGSLAGQEAMVVAAIFVIGVALLIVELMIFPGHFVSGITGFLCVMLALVYTMSSWDVPAAPPGAESEGATFSLGVYALGLRNFAAGVLGAGVVILVLARYLPRSRLFGRMVLANSAGGTWQSAPAVSAAQDISIGDTGMTCSAMRPYGTVEFGQRRLEAVMESGYLQAGVQVRVRQVTGTRIIVEPVA